jgi:cytochrome P450
LSYYGLVHPDHIQGVLKENQLNYVKGPIIGRTKILIGEGLFTSEGDFWLRQRRLAQPAFHRQRIGGFAATMTDTTAEMLDDWSGAASTGAGFDLAAEMNRLTLRIVGRALFSLDLQGDAATVGAALVDALDVVTQRAFTLFPLPLSGYPPPNRRRSPRVGCSMRSSCVSSPSDASQGAMPATCSRCSCRRATPTPVRG